MLEKQLRTFLRISGVILALLTVRVFWLSVICHDSLTKKAVSQRISAAELVTVRGNIIDRNGVSFTDCSEEEYAVYMDHADLDQGAEEIAVQTGQPASLIKSQIQSRTRLTFGPLTNPYPVERTGFMTVRVPMRQDENSIARHLIGTVDDQGRGNSGLEKMFDRFLNTGRKQSIVSLRDVRYGILGRWGYLEANRQLDQSQHLQLTLDGELQECLEQIADKAVTKGCMIVSDVESGDILAWVSRPNFDPTDLASSLESTEGDFLNRGMAQYNAGSVFKIVVAAAALEYGISQDGFACSGSYRVGDKLFSCYNGTAHGCVGLEEAFAESCNGYFIALGEKIGMERLCDMATRLGLTSSATNLEEETVGVLPTLEPELPGRLANFSIGQGELLVTPVAMLRLSDVVANGGFLRTLNVADGIVDGQGLPVRSLRQNKEKRVLSGHTAERLRQLMEKSVTDGTGKLATDGSFRAAGKTGTAETGWSENGVLQVHAWFCGFVPAEAPRYCITVFFENGQSGGSRAAPLFFEVAEEIFKFFQKRG